MRFCFGLLLALSSAQIQSAPAAPGIPLEIRGLAIQLSVFTTFVAPGERVVIRYPWQGELRATYAGEPVGEVLPGELVLQAPQEPGPHEVVLSRATDSEKTRLLMWVGRSADAVVDGRLDGYRIGDYPPPRPGREGYAAPKLFFPVTEATAKTFISPHFTIEQFLCKQAGGYPKVVVIQESLLVLLERVVAEVQGAGIDIDTLGVISGYRTPWYNRSIGNVAYSRHIYGDAMDVYIDSDRNTRMDDLNGDGRLDRKDMEQFYALVDAFLRRPENQALLGGVGRYAPNSRHGGFIHVDTRGAEARW